MNVKKLIVHIKTFDTTNIQKKRNLIRLVMKNVFKNKKSKNEKFNY